MTGKSERKVKCPICKLFDARQHMFQEENKKFYHIGNCHNTYVQVETQKKEEVVNWDALYKYIVSLHDLLILPKGNIVRLQALRNGEEIKNGVRTKKFKMGASYELMLDAYILAENDIKWCIKNTLKGSNDTSSINYCISIMMGKLNEAWVRDKNRKRQQEENITTTKEIKINERKEVKYKNTTSNNDISDFL